MKRLLFGRRRKVKSDDGDDGRGGGLATPSSTEARSGTPDAERGYRYALSAYADMVPSRERDGDACSPAAAPPAGGLRSRGPARGGGGHPQQQQRQQQQQWGYEYPSQPQQAGLSAVPERPAGAAAPSPCPTDEREGRGQAPSASAGRPAPGSEAGGRGAHDLTILTTTTGGRDGRLPWRAIPEEPRGEGDGWDGDRRDRGRPPAGDEPDGAPTAGRPADLVTADGGTSRQVWTASDSERRRFDRSVLAPRSSPGSGSALAGVRSGARGPPGPASPPSRGGDPGGRFPSLQPDAYYEEHYGDLYVDQHLRYLYPDGYQSMRPRSGPWKLSVLVFAAFLWLSVFIVGHCYERGQERYHGYDNDDAYLADADDDAIFIEARWCGSRSLYFMWMTSVWVSVLALSYCSIIGYVKVRDVAVANGRSQPCLSGGEAGRSDFYASLGDGSGGGGGAGGHGESGTKGAGRPGSYQGGATAARDGPAIYQSDGQPQFWGGHIYRPTQAAVTMTNRP